MRRLACRASSLTTNAAIVKVTTTNATRIAEVGSAGTAPGASSGGTKTSATPPDA
jgi:hypothetical protein